MEVAHIFYVLSGTLNYIYDPIVPSMESLEIRDPLSYVKPTHWEYTALIDIIFVLPQNIEVGVQKQ